MAHHREPALPHHLYRRYCLDGPYHMQRVHADGLRIVGRLPAAPGPGR